MTQNFDYFFNFYLYDVIELKLLQRLITDVFDTVRVKFWSNFDQSNKEHFKKKNPVLSAKICKAGRS